jgi:Polyketide cyclase / dehydrase and lipid transport
MNDVRIADEIQVIAPTAAVWRAIENPAEHAGWHPFLTGISGDHELDQVRTCSVVMGRKRGQTRERCVEREDGRHIAWEIEQDFPGFGKMASGWRAGFALTDQPGATTVTAESTFQPNNLFVRAMLPVIRRKFHQTQQAILRALKRSIESSAVS